QAASQITSHPPPSRATRRQSVPGTGKASGERAGRLTRYAARQTRKEGTQRSASHEKAPPRTDCSQRPPSRLAVVIRPSEARLKRTYSPRLVRRVTGARDPSPARR